ncbi:MAG: hypothetical protein WCX97_05370 [Candidatus Magasanikbacteria bacterium]|jgi:hypothetical protein
MKQKKITKSQQKTLDRKEKTRTNKEWSEAVKKRDGYKCVYSGSTEFLQSAHLFPREIETFRCDIDNGITLRAKYHKMHPKQSEDKRYFSAHQNPLAVFIWMLQNRPEQLSRLICKWNIYLGINDDKEKSI